MHTHAFSFLFLFCVCLVRRPVFQEYLQFDAIDEGVTTRSSRFFVDASIQ